MKIYAPEKWVRQAEKLIDEGLKGAAQTLHEEHGESVPFPFFLHVCLCMAIDNIYKCAPNVKEADALIKQAIEEMTEIKWKV